VLDGAAGVGRSAFVGESANSEWERRYAHSLRAEDERQGRVPGRVTFTDVVWTAGGGLSIVAMVVAGVAVLGTTVGVPYGVGVVVILLLIAGVALVVVARSCRRRRVR
jgi:Flp pilus assembly protein TadB